MNTTLIVSAFVTVQPYGRVLRCTSDRCDRTRLPVYMSLALLGERADPNTVLPGGKVMRPVVVAVMLAVALASSGLAQSVPLLSLDVTGGSGPTSSHVNEVWFSSAHVGMVGADVAIRLGSAGPTRGVLALGYSTATTSSIISLLCTGAPNGTCRVPFPYTAGASAGIGLRQAVGRSLLVGATMGVASYVRTARYVSVEAMLRPAAHVGIVARYRYSDMPYNGGRVWLAPFMLGLSTTW